MVSLIALMYVERKEKWCKTQCSWQIKREDKMWANRRTNIEPGTEKQSRKSNGASSQTEINVSSIKYLNQSNHLLIFKTSNHLSCKPESNLGTRLPLEVGRKFVRNLSISAAWVEIANGNSSKFVFSTVAILRRRISTKTLLVSIRYEANIQLWLVLFKDKLMMSSFHKRCLHELQTSTSLSASSWVFVAQAQECGLFKC